MTSASPQPEWVYNVACEDIEAPLKISFAADEETCTALARRFQIELIKEIECAATVYPQQGGDVFYVTGTVDALVQQNSAITDEPIDTAVHEHIEGWYAKKQSVVSLAKARQSKDMKKGDREVKMVDESEDPEPIIDGHINVAELAAQYLSLAIDPYLSAPDDAYPVQEPEPHTPLSFKNPFAGLLEWKDTFLKK